MAHEVISPGPVRVGNNGMLMLMVLLTNSNLSMAYVKFGTWSTTERFTMVNEEPPLLLAQTIYECSSHNCVATPQKVPLSVPN